MGLTQILRRKCFKPWYQYCWLCLLGYKLHQVQENLGHIQQSMEEGFNRVEAGLNRIENRLDSRI